MNAGRVYDVMLLVYAKQLRRDYGAEMRRLFLESRAAAQTGGWLSRVRFWWRTVRDTLIQGVGSRLEYRGARRGSFGRRGGNGGLWSGLIAGMKSLRSAPGFVVLTVSVLAVGITSAATIAVVAHHMLVRGLPYAEPERVVMGWGSTAVGGQYRDVISGPVAVDLIERNDTFSALAAFKPDGAVVMRDDRPQAVSHLTATTEFFATLGVAPFLGRWFERSDGFSAASVALS